MKKLAVLALVAMAAACAFAKNKDHDKAKVVDSGTWGIFVKGQRVASEKFKIEQSPTLSTITTETTTDSGPKIDQRSDLQISPAGQLVRYEWRELSPGHSEALVEPSNEFVVEHMKPNPPNPPRDIPFLVSTSTLILDDNVFTHREVLAWRYLASSLGGTCTPEPGDLRKCRAAKASFGVLVPKQGVSDAVTIMYAGRQEVNVKGSPRQLHRFDLSSEATGSWSLWLDDNNRMVMITIPDAHTEVIRD